MSEQVAAARQYFSDSLRELDAVQPLRSPHGWVFRRVPKNHEMRVVATRLRKARTDEEMNEVREGVMEERNIKRRQVFEAGKRYIYGD